MNNEKLLINRRGFLVGAAIAGILPLLPATAQAELRISDTTKEKIIKDSLKGLIINEAIITNEIIEINSFDGYKKLISPDGATLQLRGYCDVEMGNALLREGNLSSFWRFDLFNKQLENLTVEGEFVVTEIEHFTHLVLLTVTLESRDFKLSLA